MTQQESTTSVPRPARRIPATRNSNRLTARSVATAKPGRHCDGRGLYLAVSDSGAKKWVFRFTFNHRVTEMGLGNADVPLAQARDKAAEARTLVAAGTNPILAKRQAKRAAGGKRPFGQCANALLAAKASEWRNEKHRSQWRMTLETYAAPLWALPVDEVATEAVLSVLHTALAESPGNSIKIARANRGGARLRKSARLAFRGKPGGLARASRPHPAKAPEAHARSSCGNGL